MSVFFKELIDSAKEGLDEAKAELAQENAIKEATKGCYLVVG